MKFPMDRWSLRTRLTTVFAIVTTALIATGSIMVYFTSESRYLAVVDAALSERIDSLAVDTNGGIVIDLDDEDRLTQILELDLTIVVASPSAGTQETLVDSDTVEMLQTGRPLSVTYRLSNGQLIRSRIVLVEAPDGVRIVVAARSLEAAKASQQRLGVLLIVGSLALAAALIALESFLLKRTLLPIRRLARQAVDRDPTTLGASLDQLPGGDEFAELAAGFNALLSRIDTSRKHERSFTSFVSHELRTPIAIVRAEIDLAGLEAHDDDTRTSLSNALRQIDHLTGVIDRLFFAASAQSRALDPTRTAHVEEIVDAVMSNNPNPNAISTDLNGESVNSIALDPGLVTQIITNLYTNAQRHAHNRIRIAISDTDSDLNIVVSDDGPGYLTDTTKTSSRSATPPSARKQMGLGLSIVELLADSVGGRLVLDRDPHLHGARASVTLPIEVTRRPV